MVDDEEQTIIPRYKMIITYDIIPATRDVYYQYVLGEFVPALQEMGLFMTEAWHTAYGDHPIRMAIFVAEDMETITEAMESERWEELEGRLLRYVTNYTCKVVPYRQGFQILN